jgi:putative PIN family toxin of toxin-antitoxin system
VRVVLDTNILVSALITPGGPTDRVYGAWHDGRFVLVTSDEQLDEFRRVTRYPHLKRYIEPAAAGTMLNEVRRIAVCLTRLPRIELSRDPADDFLLAMARAGRADYLVTGDRHDLLTLGAFEKTRIVTTRDLLRELGVPRGPRTSTTRRTSSRTRR